MSLRRASCQTGSLEDFYREALRSERRVTASVGKAMLSLLPRLHVHCERREVYGLTSLYGLWLLAEDDYTSPWRVHVVAYGHSNFQVQYRMPRDEAPWSEALVTGDADGVDKAMQLVDGAMTRSRAWL